MTEPTRVKNIGLRGVTVADSAISFIDGEKGVLIYRGYRIEDLADHSTYLETAFLLLHGVLPTREQLSAFTDQVNAARQMPEFILDSMRLWPKNADPMAVLQASIPLLAMTEADSTSQERQACLDRAVGLIARMPTLVAAWHRIRKDQPVLSPDPALDHAANFLWMLQGEKPDAATARDLDICLILHADHTFNASTFAAREVVSTRASIYAGVAAGLGALSGSLHGGANAKVMEMLLTLESENDIQGWVQGQLQQGQVIMGMGHAIYKTGDPRAVYLKRIGRRLSEQTGSRWQQISETIEKTALAVFARQGKTTIQPNVDFNSAPVYYQMGIPMDLMTPVFAISRVAGWCAHIVEEQFADAQGKPALYRPQAEYVGEYCGLMGCEYAPPDKR
ncbi:citrate/2-methylcitrate synthase [Desulfobulbus alkaliphilus]|uniref:citrate/2-methylcitrate synthase n=1 Tax=Desulfobulbus alkaliphilus TaxID=869814 RepID=UPI0019661DC8|nr:citrate/2-methylcitrate synthase [Desulfobulbus alkaliphilus]MBM9538054.1 citrate (Si)-synthase [Desulfobulbus alkaliphilus]